jgi:hypothetical protein
MLEWMRIDRGNRCSRRKSAPMSRCPSQISHDVIWHQNRFDAVECLWLTAQVRQSLCSILVVAVFPWQRVIYVVERVQMVNFNYREVPRHFSFIDILKQICSHKTDLCFLSEMFRACLRVVAVRAEETGARYDGPVSGRYLQLTRRENLVPV